MVFVLVQLEQGGTEERNVASHLEIDIPNIANIQFKPSVSAAELESQTESLKTDLALLLTEYGVDNLPDAIAKEELRAESERESKQIRQKIDDALEERTEEDITIELVDTKDLG